jgi:hypothetical protein
MLLQHAYVYIIYGSKHTNRSQKNKVVKMDVTKPFCITCHVGVQPNASVTSVMLVIRKINIYTQAIGCPHYD